MFPRGNSRGGVDERGFGKGSARHGARCSRPRRYHRRPSPSRSPHREGPKGAVTGTRASDATPARLSAIAAQLAGDELAVLTLIAERLLCGRERYGELRVATDRRDFAREALEEAADGLVYAAATLVREAGRRSSDLSKPKESTRQRAREKGAEDGR